MAKLKTHPADAAKIWKDRLFKPILATLLLSWLLLWIFLAIHPEHWSMGVPMATPLTLIIFLTSQTLWPKRRFYLEWAVAASFLLLPIFAFHSVDKNLGWFFAVFGFLQIMALVIARIFFQRLKNSIEDIQHKMASLQTELKTISQQNEFYNSHVPELKSKIHQQERLSSFAHEMGTLLDAEKIKQKLLLSVGELFEKTLTELRAPALGPDPLDHWATLNRVPMLVKNCSVDERIHPSLRASLGPLSAMIVPLFLEKQLIGLLRLLCHEPQHFSEEDLEELALYAHTASLALQNAQLFSKVNAMASSDGLTGLATHQVFEERLEQEVLRAARYHLSCSVIMADIDHFKSVNDRFGHLSGDEVLKMVARTLLGNVRNIDLVARYGGEEFALILPEMNAREAAQLAERIREQIFAARVPTHSTLLQVSASFGCAAFPSDATSALLLVRRADERLYQAKTGGRNRVVAG